jgi:hypothetical protein
MNLLLDYFFPIINGMDGCQALFSGLMLENTPFIENLLSGSALYFCGASFLYKTIHEPRKR